MKNMFTYLSYLPKKLFMFIATTLAIVGLGVVVQATFGPDRPTYTMAVPADHITFNSITDNPLVGDERAFLTGALPGAANYSDPVNGVKDGDEVTLRLFYHNDAAENLGLTATNTKVKVALPTGSKQNQQITGYVNADNATPTEVYDTLDITSYNGGYFELDYVPGSAVLTNNVFTTGVALSDSIVSSGALIGYDQLNGRVPGCAQYAGWITLRVKVNMPNYQIEKRARIAGEDGTDKWRETVNANTGDTIQWLIEVKNIGSTSLENIIVLDQVPDNMTVVPGSAKLINANHPADSPYVFPPSAIQADGRQINVDIGDYAPETNAYVRFDTVVTDADEINCGENRFTNAAYATPQGYGSIVDEAYVVIVKDCGQPVYRCDALSVTQLGGRQIRADVTTTANNGASLTTITYSFGDGSTNLVTTNSSTTYTYTKDGTFTVKAVPSFKIGEQVFAATSNNCVKQVTFGTPTEIPNTGPGSMLGIFAGTSVAGAVAYRLRTIRKLSR